MRDCQRPFGTCHRCTSVDCNPRNWDCELPNDGRCRLLVACNDFLPDCVLLCDGYWVLGTGLACIELGARYAYG